MSTPIVTLTTDWGTQNFFAGMVKGLLCSLIDEVRIVDISHDLDPIDIRPAIFFVRQACSSFPEGTVHLLDVGAQPPYIVFRCRGQYFLCADNGLPYAAFGDDIEQPTVLAPQGEQAGPQGLNFAAYNLYPYVAAGLFKGRPLSDFGYPHEQLIHRQLDSYVLQPDGLYVYVHYIDRYGNAYLSLSYRQFEELRQGRQFLLTVRESTVDEVLPSYYAPHSDNSISHDLRLVVSATGMLELSVKETSFAKLFNIRVGDRLYLRFR